MPSHATIHRWLNEHQEFRDKYLAAREARADARSERMDSLVERMLEGELDPKVVSVALSNDRWQAGREAPKRYGDRLGLDGEVNLPKVSLVVIRTRPGRPIPD